jgi:hypothetical protein
MGKKDHSQTLRIEDGDRGEINKNLSDACEPGVEQRFTKGIPRGMVDFAG